AGLEDAANKATIQRVNTYVGLDSVTATSDTDVRLKLSQPNASILTAIADWRQIVVPVEMPSKLPWEKPELFPGVGPFICDAYQDGQKAHYKANPKYWQKPYPFIDEATYNGYGDR